MCETSWVQVPFGLCAFSSCDIWWPKGSLLGVWTTKGLSCQFQADSGTNLNHKINESPHDKTTKNDLSAQLRLISLGICWVWSVFAVRIKKHWALNYLLSTQWGVWRLIRLGDAEADLSVRWAHVTLSVCEMSWVRVLVRLCAFSTCDIWWPVRGGVHARGSSSKRTVSSVPSRFGDKSN